ncbi:MAG TPA: hypothetical protein VH682_10120 [Gemmataceae bacterium]|jgi:hypothetical protein
MPTLSKIVFSAVLVCLLLSLLGGGRRLHGGRGNHVRRDRHRIAVRLRRLRTDYPSHQPVRPWSSASIPPDEDDDDEERFRLAWEDTHELMTILVEEPRTTYLTSCPSAWPSAPDQPFYRTLCTLLI